MTRILGTLSALLIASAAAADEYLYIYVSAKDAEGGTVRHRLECTEAKCKAEIKGGSRTLELSDDQRRELRAALQAEARGLVLGADAPAGDDKLMKLKVKHETPRQRVTIERRVPADNPDVVTPQMRGVLKAYLDLELESSAPEETSTGDAEGAAPVPKNQGSGD